VTTPRIVAIDGPAASGKSSTAALVANALGLAHIDSGSLYRAVTWIALESRLDRPEAITAAADALPVTLKQVGQELLVHAAGRPIDTAIRDAAVTGHVSAVSAMPLVRDWVNRLLRRAVSQAGGAVVDGRDIGSVVFPEAPLKVFLTASPAVRARRRLLQRDGGVDDRDLVSETALLAERDRRDSSRVVAPLRPGTDALLLDTTDLTIEAQVEKILKLAETRGLSTG
jgi:cytidylate kinase